jgi:sporulation protein YlmC with PRC-barrel domain
MIRASDLIGCDVRTESGEKLGRVHELRAGAEGGGLRLLGLVVGRRGMLERLMGDEDSEEGQGGTVVPWEAVVSVDDGRIAVRDVVADHPPPG